MSEKEMRALINQELSLYSRVLLYCTRFVLKRLSKSLEKLELAVGFYIMPYEAFDDLVMDLDEMEELGEEESDETPLQ